MTLNDCLALAFALPAIASYLAWCAGRLPRTRVVLAILSIVCLAVGMGLHGSLLAAAD